MLNLIISGCNGFAGQAVAAVAAEDPEVKIVAGFDIDARQLDSFPVYSSPDGFSGKADIVVDFSNPSALEDLLSFGLSGSTPLVLCATGYTDAQIAGIADAAERIPVFRSGNTSLGINLLVDLIRRSCAVLGDAFDVEIVERHHRRKIDAPSGTALMLAGAAAAALPYDAQYVFERHGRRAPREKREIGISSVRGGTIVGEHDVIFAGPHEVIELRHSSASNEVFARGALRAAKFLAGVGKPGLYDMSDVLFLTEKQ